MTLSAYPGLGKVVFEGVFHANGEVNGQRLLYQLRFAGGRAVLERPRISQLRWEPEVADSSMNRGVLYLAMLYLLA